MRVRASARQATDVEPFLPSSDETTWFVYLFALADCTAFKVGFSCNPLQRICTFSRRFFEYFDLSQSLIVEVPHCDDARALEALLKMEFAEHRAQMPTWVPREAGGHTEWFSAVYFEDAQSRLRSAPGVQVSRQAFYAFDSFRAGLQAASASFERWALSQAARACDAWSAAERGYAVRDETRVLRDWIDAYRYFEVPLFVEDREALEFVRQSTRLRR